MEPPPPPNTVTENTAQDKTQPEPNSLAAPHGGESSSAAARTAPAGERARDDARGARQAQRRRDAGKGAQGDELGWCRGEARAQGAAGLEQGAQEADAAAADEVRGRRAEEQRAAAGEGEGRGRPQLEPGLYAQVRGYHGDAHRQQAGQQVADPRDACYGEYDGGRPACRRCCFGRSCRCW